MVVQIANAKGNRPTFQNVDRMKAPAEGQAGAPRPCRRVEHECEVFVVVRGLFRQMIYIRGDVSVNCNRALQSS